MNETFGQWLERMRKAAGLNQTELAERARVTKATISLYEQDKIAQPRNGQIEKIAKALGVPVDDAQRRAAGYADTDPDGLYRGLSRLPLERQPLARRQIRAIIDSLAAQDEHDTDYINDTKEPE